jgi:HEXXH motif-containing protein
VLSPGELDDVAVGAPAAAALAELVADQRDRQLAILALVSANATPDAVGDELSSMFSAALRTLAERYRINPGAVNGVVHYPGVTACATKFLHLRRGDDDPGGRDLLLAQLASMGAAVAVHAGGDTTPAEIICRHGVIVLAGAGRILLPVEMAGLVRVAVRSDSVEVGFAGSRARIALSGSDPRWQPVRRLATSRGDHRLDVCFDDVDPCRAIGAPPADRLGRAAVDRWQRTLADAWALLVDHHPQFLPGIASMLRMLVPLRSAPTARSESSRAVPGLITSTEPTSAARMAETLVHETRHHLLWSVHATTPLHGSDGDARFYAPWRDDARPLSGLLHGVFAFLGVADFWRRQRWLVTQDEAEHAHLRFARGLAQTRVAVDQLVDCPGLTPAGARLVRVMVAQLDSWRTEWVPAAASGTASRELRDHRERWRQRYHAAGPTLSTGL